MPSFGPLDFVYLPSHSVADDVEHFTRELGGELVFAIERFGTRVAMVKLADEPPALLLAEHLEGDQPVLVYRVEDLEATLAELADRGAEVVQQFGIPHGPGAEIANPGPQRIAIYELTRPERAAGLAGRRDF
jgi:hypothetical protein